MPLSRIIIVLGAAIAAWLISSLAASASILEGRGWHVSSLAGKAVDEGGVLQFGGDRLKGRAACNRMFADITIQGSSLKIGPIGATRMACTSAKMDVEARLFAALEKTRAFEVSGTNLILKDDAGSVLASLESTP